jgi:hypothetical protein
VRTARTQRPRTPDACPSGLPDRTGRVDTGRVDTGRPPDQWTRTGRPAACPASGQPRRPRRPPVGWPKSRSGYRICGARQLLTAPRLRHLPARPSPPQRLSSCAAPLGMKPRLGALLSSDDFRVERRANGDASSVMTSAQTDAGWFGTWQRWSRSWAVDRLGWSWCGGAVLVASSQLSWSYGRDRQDPWISRAWIYPYLTGDSG